MDKNFIAFQAFLDAISDCFISGDPSPWEERIELPFSLITKDGPVVLTTTEEVRENFEKYRLAVRLMNLDQVCRSAISLQDCGDDSWIGTFRTDLISRDLRLVDYTSSVLLLLDGDDFKMRSMLNARGHHDWTGDLP